MEDKDRPYTEEEFKELFKQSGIDEIAKDYCRTELEEWMDHLKNSPLRNFQTIREEAWYNVVSISHPDVYAVQRKNGQSHEWAKAFAEDTSTYDGREDKLYMCIQAAYNSIVETDPDKELTIFFNNFSDDPVYNKICKKYFREVAGYDWLKLSQEYTREFYKCKENGKSDMYADAYADAFTSDYTENYCQTYAEIKECAINHGLSDSESDFFASFCAENYGNETLFTGIRGFNKNFKESWEKEIYYNLMIRAEEEGGNIVTKSYKNAIREELGLPSGDDSYSSED